MATQNIPPIAPPLPAPTSTGQPRRADGPSFDEHFASFAARFSSEAAKERAQTDSLPTGTYFLYNELMQRHALQEVLGSQTENLPPGRPGCIIGYSIAKSKDQKLLLAAEPPLGEMVRGLTVDIGTAECVASLLEYMSRFEEEFEVSRCQIHFEDGEEPGSGKGWVMVYSGSRDGLKKPGFADSHRWKKMLDTSVADAVDPDMQS